jgi:probable DNA repair protein
MLERALDALDSGATLVTPNRRLTRTLRRRFNSRQRGRGLAVWPTADVLPWSAWLRRLWDAGARSDAYVLSSLQEQLLWEEAIAKTHPTLMRPAHAAKLAHEAWNLLHAWRIHEVTAPSGDAAAFNTWSRSYVQHCQEHAWIDSARMPDKLIRLARELPPPGKVALAGFDELTPQQRDVAAAFACSAIPKVEDKRTNSCSRVACDDAKAEMLAAARWARERVSNDPYCCIGILVPGLEQKRAAIEAVFADVFHPASALPGAKVAISGFNISLAPPLAQAPIVAAALAVIEAAGGELPIAKMGALVRSPFLGGASSEFSARALLDASLRHRCESTKVLAEVLPHAADGAAMLAEHLTAMGALSIGGSRRPGEWASLFRDLLKAAGWPGDRTLDSAEYQAVQSWDEVLSGFCSLDAIVTAFDYKTAAGMLRRLTSEKLFQPESPEVPVQILGVREALGHTFDHVWMMGLHDDAWPARCRPNPFIPLDVQRKRNLPHATPERELAYAKGVLDAIVSSAQHVVVSWPVREGDVELSPSRLIAAYPIAEPPASSFTLYRDVIHRSRRIEEFADERGAPLIEAAVTRGGYRVFEYQAACPFRAFAAFRLQARPLDEPSFGVDAMLRGILAHSALAEVWKDLRSHAALIATGKLEEIVSAAVEKALSGEMLKRPRTLTAPCAALEKRRLHTLLMEWLNLDRARAPFESVDSEVEVIRTIAGLTVNLKIDRIDHFADGTTAISDYKTGKCNPNDWFGERPDAPQLPLYAHGDEGVAAISYALVRRGECQYSGYSRSAGVADGIEFRDDWTTIVNGWQRVLETLARQFLNGVADVAPKVFPGTCDNCELPALCRIAERGPKSNG